MIEQITPSQVYSCLWKCRDLEIQMLWTRLTLLGAFMALTYTGYGVLMFKGLDGIQHWKLFNLLAMGTCAFGFIFSLLWTLTAKGSKAWFERYEAALSYFQKTYRDIGLFARMASEDLVLSYLDFGKRYIRREAEPVDSNVFTQNAGAYSVSKIPIIIGQLSMVAWLLLAVFHWLLLLVGKLWTKESIEHGGVGVLLGFFGLIGMICICCAICKAAKSGFFKTENNET